MWYYFQMCIPPHNMSKGTCELCWRLKCGIGPYGAWGRRWCCRHPKSKEFLCSNPDGTGASSFYSAIELYSPVLLVSSSRSSLLPAGRKKWSRCPCQMEITDSTSACQKWWNQWMRFCPARDKTVGAQNFCGHCSGLPYLLLVDMGCAWVGLYGWDCMKVPWAFAHSGP